MPTSLVRWPFCETRRFTRRSDCPDSFGAAISSHGSLRRLEAVVQRLRVDWRDVIMAAEYKPSGNTFLGSSKPKRIFDFNRPIQEATVTDDRS